MINHTRFQGTWGVSKDTGMMKLFINHNHPTEVTETFGKFAAEINNLPPTMHISYQYPSFIRKPDLPDRDYIRITYAPEGGDGFKTEMLISRNSTDGWKFWQPELPEKLIRRALKVATALVSPPKANG